MVSAYFLDSSALVKRYVREAGSTWIRAITAPESENVILLARISWVEVLSALARLEREHVLQPATIATTVRAFRRDWDTQYQVVELDGGLAQAAGQLVMRHPLRAYDSVQLASALQTQPAFAHAANIPFNFISADDRLLKVAQAEGLTTDNPNHYSS